MREDRLLTDEGHEAVQGGVGVVGDRHVVYQHLPRLSFFLSLSLFLSLVLSLSLCPSALSPCLCRLCLCLCLCLCLSVSVLSLSLCLSVSLSLSLSLSLALSLSLSLPLSHLARIRLVEALQQADARALAAARGPHQRHHLRER